MTAPHAVPMSTDPVAIATLAVLGALLLLAAASDLAARRIPNLLVVAGLLLAAGGHALSLATGQHPLAGPRPGAPLAGLVAGGLALSPLYLLRGCAAGDVKLMAMVGAFLGAATALEATLATLVCVGLLSLLNIGQATIISVGPLSIAA